MVDESLVAAEISDQFGTPGRKRQAWMEMSLMDRQCRVDCSTTAMDDDCARECQMDQPGPKEVKRHLVRHARRRRSDSTQHAEIICRCPGEKSCLVPGGAGAVPRCSTLVPEMQLVARSDLGMHGDDLLDQSCVGPRHATAQHRGRIAASALSR